MLDILNRRHAIHLSCWILFAAGCWYEVYLAMAIGQIVALMNMLWIYVPIVLNLVVVSGLVGAGFVARSVTSAGVHIAMGAGFLLIAQLYQTAYWLRGVAAH
ncbi:MAG: hypothetical protein GY948_17515 [Alphaproteobacteria bacterium]|nr:hypothetical protein [Alphaproteobacteria bacterium]